MKNQKLCDVCGQKVGMGGEYHRYHKHTKFRQKSERWPEIPCWFDTEWPRSLTAEFLKAAKYLRFNVHLHQELANFHNPFAGCLH